jgi:autotransporter-associated beta strand protein
MKNNPRSFLFHSSLLAALFALSLNLHAGTLWWDGSATTVNGASDNASTTATNWLNPSGGNWDNGTASAPLGTWNAGDNAIFGGTAASQTITAGTITVGNLTFGQGAQGAGTNGTANTITGGTLTLSSGSTITANTATAINSTLAGTTGFTKSGLGALTNSGANTFAGSVTLSQGTLVANHASALGSATNTLVLGDANTGANPVVFRINPGVAAAVTLTNLSTASYGTSQTIILNAGSALGANISELNATFNLNGTLPLTIQSTNTGGHSTAQDVNWLIKGTGIAAGSTALTLDGSGYALRFSRLDNTSGASDFSGDVVITGNVTTQNRTYVAQTAGNQNLGFTNNNITVNPSSTWTLVWGGETMGALNGSGTVSLNCQNALNNIGLTMGNNNANGFFSGALGGGTWQIAKVGTGKQVLAGTGITLSAATTVNNGSLSLSNCTAWASSVTITSPGVLDLNNDTATAWTFGKAAGGTGNLTKSGSGAVILSVVQTYSGPTTINAGQVYANAGLNLASAITVSNNATFGGKSTAGAVTVAPGGAVEGGQAGVGMLTLSNLTYNGTGNLRLTLASNNVPLLVTSNIVTSATAVTVMPGNAPLPGTYPVLRCLGTISGAGFALVNPPRTMSLSSYSSGGTNYVDLVVLPAGAYPIWTGAFNSEWSLNSITSPKNWKLNADSSPTDFMTSDTVAFDDSTPSNTVNISVANVNPGSTTFSNAARDYVLAGAYGIASGSVTKTGSGLLTLSNVNTYGGGTTISNGTVAFVGGGLGSGTVSLAGTSTLRLIGASSASVPVSLANGITATFDTPASTLTVASATGGTGTTLVKSGAGQLVLSAANTFTGGAIINAGTLSLGNAGALNSSSPNAITLGASGAMNPTLTIGSGVADGASFGALTVPATVTGATLSFPQNSATRSYTFAGASLSSPLILNQSSASSPNWSQVTWTSKITGTGGGPGNDTVILNNTSSMQNYWTMSSGVTNDFIGNIHVKAGVIAVQSGSPGANYFIPDASLLWIESGEWRWNTGGSVETIDGLAGAGLMGNPGNVTLTINATNSANDGKRVFSGTLGNMGGTLTLGGTGKQVLMGANIIYTTPTAVTNGILSLSNCTAWASAVIVNSPGALELDSPSAWTFGKAIGGTGNMTKLGNGTLTFTVAQTYSGNTAVNAGILYANGGLNAAGAVSVAANATLGGTNNAGAVKVADGGRIEGGIAGSGTLGLGSLTFNGAGTLTVSPAASYLPLNVVGGLTNNGTVTIAVGNVPALGANYHLLQFGSGLLAGTGSFVLAPSRNPYSIQTNGTYLDLVVGPVALYPVWTGASSSAWSTNPVPSPKNWKLNTDASATDFQPNDAVLFDDSAITTAADISSAPVSPVSVAFNNTLKNYTLTGAYGIASGSVTKTGSGLLTLSNVNTYAGGTTLSNGTIEFVNGALGSGTMTLAGTSTLRWLNGNTAAVPLALGNGITATLDTSANSVTVPTALGGTGTLLVKTGPGTLTLTNSASTYAGGTIISRGKVVLGAVGSAGSGGITLGDAATGPSSVELSFSAVPTNGTYPDVTVSSSGTGNAIISGTANALNNNPAPNTHVTMNRATILRANSLGASDLQGKLSGPGAGAGNTTLIIDANGGTLRYTAAATGITNDFVGNVLITNGIFQPQNLGYLAYNDANNNLAIPDTASVTVAAGSTLHFAHTWYEIIDGLNGAGTVDNGFTAPGQSTTLVVGGGNGNGNFSGRIINNYPIALTKIGSGTQILSGTNTYTGPTIVSNGVLQVDGSLAAGSTVMVAGGTLSGTGTVGGSVNVQAGGTLSPGASIGTLTIGGALTLAGTTYLELDKGSVTNDRVNAASLTNGGALVLSNYSGTLARGDSFKVFNAASYTGSFASISSTPSLGAGLNWWMGPNGTLSINGAPDASDLAMGVDQGGTNTLQIIGGKHAPTDLDPGDTANLSVTAVALTTPGNGGVVSITGGTSVTYIASASFNGTDSFTYTVSDGRGGSVTKTVTVTVAPASTGANLVAGSLSVVGSVATMQGYGIPNAWYHLQYTTNLMTVNWQDVLDADVQANPSNGSLPLTDSNATDPMRYYRTRYVSGP